MADGPGQKDNGRMKRYRDRHKERQTRIELLLPNDIVTLIDDMVEENKNEVRKKYPLLEKDDRYFMAIKSCSRSKLIVDMIKSWKPNVPEHSSDKKKCTRNHWSEVYSLVKDLRDAKASWDEVAKELIRHGWCTYQGKDWNERRIEQWMRQRESETPNKGLEASITVETTTPIKELNPKENPNPVGEQ